MTKRPDARRPKEKQPARCQWLTPIILVTMETEIRRIDIRSQPRQIVPETLYQKNPSPKRAGGVAQGVGPSSNPSTSKKEKRKKPAKPCITRT
jgi:hypothetical protein